MNNILNCLKRYPGMQIQDIVKLIYQSEFAGGHMLKNEKDSMKRLYEEFATINSSMVAQNTMAYRSGITCYDIGDNTLLFENIGNGLCRLHLAALHNIEIDLATINKFFYNTALSIKGDLKIFERKLEKLKIYCRDGILPFQLDDLEGYIYNYKKQGYPPVSHSEVYKKLYNPSYRVVKEVYKTYFSLFCRIDTLLKTQNRIIVAIDGNSAAGKTTLSVILKEIYDKEINIFHMDDFFLTPELKTKERIKEVGGNVDYVRFKKEVIDGILSDKEFCYRVYDCKSESMKRTVKVRPERINIVEGAYSMHPTLIDNYSLKVFIGISKEEQKLRILERNGSHVQEMFLTKWIPMEDEYIDKMNIKEKSDLIFCYCPEVSTCI